MAIQKKPLGVGFDRDGAMVLTGLKRLNTETLMRMLTVVLGTPK